MAQIIPSRNGWEQAGKDTAQAYGDQYFHSADQRALQNALGGLPPNATPRQILDAMTMTKTYSNTAKQEAFKNRLGVSEFEETQRHAKAQEENTRAETIRKANEDNEKRLVDEIKERKEKKKEELAREATRALASKLDLDEETRNILGETASEATVKDLIKEQFKNASKKPGQTDLQKNISKELSKEYIQLSKDLPALKQNLESIDDVEKLSNDIGWLGRANQWSDKVAELNAKAFPIIKPIIDIFNPAGPLAVSKMKILLEQHKPSSWDTPGQVQGKIKALRHINNQSIERVKKRIELIEKYDANVPMEELKKLNEEDMSVVDALLDYDFKDKGEPVDIPGMPDAKDEKYKGETLVGPDGSEYYSDGKGWFKR